MDAGQVGLSGTDLSSGEPPLPSPGEGGVGDSGVQSKKPEVQTLVLQGSPSNQMFPLWNSHLG